MGLGIALNEGLKHCSYDLVARMDTDDVSMPNRFEKQLEVFIKNSDIDVCSAWVGEFNIDENIITSYRKVPCKHEDIVKFAKLRSPINHPVVMYKKQSVIKAGSYIDMRYFEDYYLWARMIIGGSKFYNIQEVLLNMRANDNMIKRRKGLTYLKYELLLLKELKKIKFINNVEYLINLIIRIPVRIVPQKTTLLIYRFIRKININRSYNK